jgi:LysM repeat protein
MKIDPDLHHPPVLRVTWGSLDFRCVLAKANQKFIKFFADGRPARSRITVTFNEYVDAAAQVAEANLQTSDFSKAYTTTDGDTLATIAAKFYDDPKKWRPIARANNIVDPRAVAAGQHFRIPALPFTDPATGIVTV